MISDDEVNSNCQIKLKIVEGKWKKGADLMGKMDPYIKFEYDDEEYQTKIKHGAGKHAVFNEIFILNDIKKQID